ncbi:hypothetical protein JHK87_035393 [Glycine soja]|nr:hypothetical protein JHK87_035393 [Glycine soja]
MSSGWKFRAAEQFLCFWHEYRNGLLYGWYLCRLFQLNELFLTEPQKARIYHYYVPVFLWCEQQITEHQSKFKDGEDIPPLVDVSSKAIINRAELSSNYRTSSGSDMTLSSSDDRSCYKVSMLIDPTFQHSSKPSLTKNILRLKISGCQLQIIKDI